MFNKNKILNAINEGIKTGFKFSSSSNIDDSSYIDFSDSKVNKVESFNIGKLENDFVDLGLSVKWAKCNIGATCQDTPDSWYGNYYAWGEIEPKQVYNKNTYNQTLYKKYSEDSFHILQPEDDVVTQTYYGIGKFRMPTEEEIKELLDKTKIKNKWKTNYQGIEGLNGREFISLINGNSIFIPASGFFLDSVLYRAGSYCNLWSSFLEQDDHDCAQDLHFITGSIFVSNYYRYGGLSVRGICQN